MSPARALPPGLTKEQREALRRPLCRETYHFIDRHPGVSVTGLVRGMRIGWSSTYRRLGALAEAGLVRQQREGRACFLFTAAFPQAPDAARAASRLVAPPARALAEEIRRHPGESGPALIRRLPHFSPRVLYHHLRRLLDAGLVTSASTGRYKDLRATPALDELLRRSARE